MDRMKKYFLVLGSAPVNQEIFDLLSRKYPELEIIQVSYGGRQIDKERGRYVQAVDGQDTALAIEKLVGNGKVKGLVNRADSHILLAGRLVDYFRLDGAGYEASLRFKDKERFHEYVVETVGSQYRPKAKACNLQEVEEELAGVQYPVLVKPIMGAKSRGIFVLREETDLAKAKRYWQEYFKKDKYFRGAGEVNRVMIEEYVEGGEMLTVTAFVDVEGKLKLMNLVDVWQGRDVGQRHMQLVYRVMPSVRDKAVLKEVGQVLRGVVESSGLRACFIHPDFLIKGQRVVFLELNVRIGGFRKEMMWFSQGIDLDEINIDLALGKQVDWQKKVENSVTAVEVWEDKSGILRKIKSPKNAKIKRYKEYVKVGCRYIAPPVGDRPLARFLVVDKENSLNLAEEMRDGLEVVIR